MIKFFKLNGYGKFSYDNDTIKYLEDEVMIFNLDRIGRLFKSSEDPQYYCVDIYGEDIFITEEQYSELIKKLSIY